MAALPPVQALTAVLPLGRSGGQASQQPSPQGGWPAVGEQLVLLLERRLEGGEWLASGPRGLQLRLPLQGGSPGERLTLQVLPPQEAAATAAVEEATSGRQRLALQLVAREAAGAPAAAGGGSAWGPAMRDDQAWRLRLATPAAAARRQPVPALPLAAALPSEMQPASLAAQWRGRVLAEVLRASPPADPAAGPQPASVAGPHHLPGWHGQALLLRLLSPLEPREDRPAPLPAASEESTPRQQDEAAGHHHQDEPGEGLRLGLILSLDGDWVQVLLQWQQGGLLLHLSAERPDTLQALRSLLPRISAALAAVPLPLRHCQLSSRPPAMPPLPSERQSQGLAHASSNALFRAAAEIAAVLQQPG